MQCGVSMAGEGETGFGAPSNCLGAERQDEAPRHGLPEQREDRIGKRDPSPPWLGWCIAGGGGG